MEMWQDIARTVDEAAQDEKMRHSTFSIVPTPFSFIPR
jgi:hypothetical protein